MSDEKYMGVTGRGLISSPVANTNLALAAETPVEFGPFELSSARSESRSGGDGEFADERSRRSPRSKPLLKTNPPKPGSQSRGDDTAASHSEEYYLSAALAEEGSRPSLAFVFPPLARAIEDAAREVQAPGTRTRRPFGRGHLHVVEGRSSAHGSPNSADADGGARDPFEIDPPDRNYDCPNYDTCLGLAAALNWNSFACTGCSGSVNQHLLWRAHSEVRKNKTLAELCDLPEIVAETGVAELVDMALEGIDPELVE